MALTLPPQHPDYRSPAKGTSSDRSRARLVRIPTDILAKIEKLVRMADRFEVMLDDVMRSLEEIGWRTTPANAPDRTGRRMRGPRAVWVTKAECTLRPDGSLVVTLDEDTLLLQPHLGALFLALAEDTGTAPDGGIAFKTVSDLANRVSKRLDGRLLSNDTINKYVFKLRRIIARETRLPADVIQTNIKLGRRLAARRGGTRTQFD